MGLGRLRLGATEGPKANLQRPVHRPACRLRLTEAERESACLLGLTRPKPGQLGATPRYALY